jgi:hypothetical protein
MHSSHVVAGTSIFGYTESDLTRRANQGHFFSIPPSDPSQADRVFQSSPSGPPHYIDFQIVFHLVFRKYPVMRMPEKSMMLAMKRSRRSRSNHEN